MCNRAAHRRRPAPTRLRSHRGPTSAKCPSSREGALTHVVDASAGRRRKQQPRIVESIRGMSAPEEVIRRYVEATSAADPDTAADLTADHAAIQLPNGVVLEGKEGARQFAARHAETDGRKQ